MSGREEGAAGGTTPSAARVSRWLGQAGTTTRRAITDIRPCRKFVAARPLPGRRDAAP